jgi:hypothetical protein
MKVACFIACLALAAAVPQIRLTINHEAGKAYRLKNPIVRDHDLVKGVKSRQDWTQKCAAGKKTNAKNCPFPVAAAHDHHEESVPVRTRVFEIDELYNGPRGSTKAGVREVKFVNFGRRGTYLFKYDAKDQSGNHAEQVVFGLILDDTTAPTINLCNGNQELVEAASKWKLCSSTVTNDNLDGATPQKYTVWYNGVKVVTKTTFARARASISTRKVGKWVIQVDTHDYAGVYGHDGQNNAATVKKTVFVKDTKKPWIHMVGANPAVFECSHTKQYRDAKATAADLLDGDITKNIKSVDTVVETKVGKYTVTYDVKDKALNEADTQTRNIKVVDTTKPKIALKGDTEVVHYSGKKFTDAWVTTSDLCDKALAKATAKWDKPFNDRKVGTYIRTYKAVDYTGNSNSVRRTFTIIDNTRPVLTLRGKDIQTLEATRDSEYVDRGAKCHDYVDGPLSHAVEVSGKVVNMRIPGMYNIYYSCQDLSGNEAKKIHRRIVVRDTTCPKVKVNGAGLNYVEAGFPYMDAGATATDSLDGDLTKAITTDGDTVDTAQVFYARRSCKEIKDYYPAAKAGEYFITPKDSHRTLVWCAMGMGETVFPCKKCKRVIPYASDHGDCVKKGMFMAKYSAAMMKVATNKFKGFVVSKGASTDSYFCSTNDAHVEYNEHKKAAKKIAMRAEAGKFIIHFHVQDRAGNKECTTAKRTVIVKESLPPVVSLKLMAETASVNGWIIGAMASAVAGVALLSFSSKSTLTIEV